MSEEAPSKNELDESIPKDAVWHSNEGDIQIKITGEIKSTQGKTVFYKVEGMDRNISADEVTFGTPENQPDDSASNEAEQDLSVERQFARHKVVEFLNGRQKRELQNKKGNYEFKVAQIEAMRDAASIGDFESPVTIFDSEGQVVTKSKSVKKYLESLMHELSDQAVRLAEKVDAGDDSKISQRDKTYKLFDIVEEVLKSVEAAVASKAPEKQESKPENPKPTDENSEKNEQKSSSKEDSNKPPKHEQNNAYNSRWLDPRFIIELKEKYAKALAEHDAVRQRLNDSTSEHYKNILKTRVIESAISDRLNRTEWLSGGENLGKGRWEKYFNPSKEYVYESPSDDVKKIIASRMDEPHEKLQAEADKASENFAQKHHTFKAGENINLVRSDNSVDEGWTVDKTVFESGDEWVWISKGRDRRKLIANYLKAQQEIAPATDEGKMEKLLRELRPYFNGPAKIRVSEDHVIRGRFAGLNMKGKVYLQYDVYRMGPNDEPQLDTQGRPLKNVVQIEVDPETFFEWQKLKTNEEVAEEQNRKLERINSEIPEEDRKFQLGQEVKFIKDEKAEPGWIVDDFSVHQGEIIVKLIKENESVLIEQDLLENHQMAPDGYDRTKVEADQDQGTDQDATQADIDGDQSDPTDQAITEDDEDSEDLEEKERKRREKLEAKIKPSWWDSYWEKQRKINEEIDKIKDVNEKKRRKNQRKAIKTLGGVALFTFGWNIGVFAAAGGGPVLLGQHRYRKFKNKRIKKKLGEH